MHSSIRLPAALAGAALLAGEIYVAVLGLCCTREPPAYDAYYITHTSRCWPPPGPDLHHCFDMRHLLRPDAFGMVRVRWIE
jgi:hypothetical protein